MAVDILACASLTGICETNLSVSELMTSVKVKVVDNNLVIALIRTRFTRLVCTLMTISLILIIYYQND